MQLCSCFSLVVNISLFSSMSPFRRLNYLARFSRKLLFDNAFRTKTSKRSMKSSEELKDLYGEEYAESFAKTQSPRRLERLIKYIDVNKAQTVADFACGNGILMEHVAPKVKT